MPTCCCCRKVAHTPSRNQAQVPTSQHALEDNHPLPRQRRRAVRRKRCRFGWSRTDCCPGLILPPMTGVVNWLRRWWMCSIQYRSRSILQTRHNTRRCEKIDGFFCGRSRCCFQSDLASIACCIPNIAQVRAYGALALSSVFVALSKEGWSFILQSGACSERKTFDTLTCLVAYVC